jgi:hypothetical protein
MKIYTADREAGNKIEEFNTIEEAKQECGAHIKMHCLLRVWR